MTDPAGPDERHSIAALAVHVSGLERDLQAQTGKVSALASTQRQHAVLLDGLAELRQQIDQIMSLLTGRDDDTLATWFWLTMPDEERSAKLAELTTDWVDGVLRVQYPAYTTDQIRPCWPNHPEAWWELAWLYQLWTQAYLAEHGAPRDAADWHDRWRPGVIRRLSEVTRRCPGDCQPDPRQA